MSPPTQANVEFTLPLVVPASPAAPILAIESILRAPSIPAASLPRVPSPADWVPVTYGTKTGNPAKRRRKARREAKAVAAKEAKLRAAGIAKAWKIRAAQWNADEQQAASNKAAKQAKAAAKAAATKAAAAARPKQQNTSPKRRQKRQLQRKQAGIDKQVATKTATEVERRKKRQLRENLQVVLHRHNTRFQHRNTDRLVAALPARETYLAACAVAACNGTPVPPVPFLTARWRPGIRLVKPPIYQLPLRMSPML